MYSHVVVGGNKFW